MKTMDESEAAAMAIGAIVGLTVGLWCGCHAVESKLHSDAIQNGHAEYDSKTGEWRWKEVK